MAINKLELCRSVLFLLLFFLPFLLVQLATKSFVVISLPCEQLFKMSGTEYHTFVDTKRFCPERSKKKYLHSSAWPPHITRSSPDFTLCQLYSECSKYLNNYLFLFLTKNSYEVLIYYITL